MKPTKERMARSFGWYLKRAMREDLKLGYKKEPELIWHSADGKKFGLRGTSKICSGLPDFTTDLNDITAALIEVGVYWHVEIVWGAGKTVLFFVAVVAGVVARGETPALALCAAWLKYEAGMACSLRRNCK